MKNLKLFILALSTTFLLSAAPERSLLNLYKQSVSVDDVKNKGKAITYLGHFQFPQTVKDPTLRLYYKGRIVEVDNGSFSIIEHKKFQVFTIVTALLSPPTTNTIATMEIPEGVSYTHYTLFRTAAASQEDKKCEEWHIEKSSGNSGLNIPSDALVVLIDPLLIKDLNIHSWQKNSFTLKLPSFTIRKDLPKKSFDSAYNRSLLTALDWDGFHERVEWEHKKHKRSHTARKRLA
jgi:hypothetical protein